MSKFVSHSENAASLNLIYGVKSGNLRLVNLLISRGVDLNFKDGEGRTAMHYAMHSSETIAKTVIQYYDSQVQTNLLQGMEPPENIFNVKDERGNTPLHEAVYNARPYEVFSMLLRGADPSIENKDGVSPASYNPVMATGEKPIGSRAISSMLCDARFRDPLVDQAKLSEEYQAKIDDEMKYGRREYSEGLITKRIRKKHAISRIEESEAISRITGSAIAMTALPFPSTVQMLFEDYIREKRYEDLSLILSDEAHRTRIDINADLSYGSKKHPRNALMLAAQSGDADLLNILINSGANLNIKDKHGNTPLHYAAASLNFEAVDILVSNGASIQAKNNKGQTALHTVTEVGFPKIRSVKSGTQTPHTMPYIKSDYPEDDRTPTLHYASGHRPSTKPTLGKYNSAIYIYNYLVRMGSNPSAPDLSHQTPESILGKVGIATDEKHKIVDSLRRDLIKDGITSAPTYSQTTKAKNTERGV